MSNVFKHEDGESPLIPLLKNKKTAFEDGSIMRLLRRDFDIVCKARNEGVSWAEIARAFGFEGKAAQARYAFFYERKRKEKKGIKAPEKTEKEVTDDQKNREKRIVPPVSKPVTRAPGQQIGQVTLTGKGQFLVNEETPLDEL